MGKLRLECPNCGKAVAVSDTAKKARCPGCKQVMDVAAVLAGDAGESTEPPAGQEVPEAGGEAQAAGEGAEVAAEAPKEEKRASRSAAKAGRRSGKKSRRAPSEGGEAAQQGDAPRPPVFSLPGGAQPWMIIAFLAVVAAIVLFLVANVNPVAVIGIVSGVGLFIDSALMRITRVSPSAKGWGSMPMVWGLIGFVPVVGVVLYAVLRKKLVANSPEDIATPDMDDDDISFEGKVRPPSIASVGAVLVLALAIFAGIFYQMPPSTWVDVGTEFSQKSGAVAGQNPRHFYDMGQLYAVFHSNDPIADYGGLSFDVLKLNADGSSESVVSGKVEANISNDEPRKGVFQFEVISPGKHRLVVKDSEGSEYAAYDFRILKSANR